MEVTIEEKVTPNEWEALVASVPEGSFYQTAEHAELWKELHGSKALFLKASESGQVLGIMLALQDGFGQQVIEERKPLKKFAVLTKKALPYIHWTYGPIVMEKSRKKEVLNALLTELIKYCCKKNVYLAEGCPPIHAEALDDATRQAYSEAGFDSRPFGTFLVKLNRNPEEIWENLDKAAKKAITGCNEQGITVSKAETEAEVKEYLQLLTEFRKKNKLLMPPAYPTLKFWKDNKGKKTDILLARQAGKLVSGMGIVYFNGIITEIAVARDLECKAYAQDAIKWKILEWGAKNGFRWFDLAGVNPNPQTQKEKGGYQFKAKWGGDLVTYDEYHKNFSRIRAGFISCLKNIRANK